MFRSEPEVLVVGAGPVGLFAALHVAHRGHRVRVIDKEWRPTAHSYALTLHGQVLGLLDELGLLGPVLASSHKIRRVGFYDRDRPFAAIDLQTQHQDYSFAAVIRQDILERLLTDALAARGVKVLWNHEMTGFGRSETGLDVTIDKLARQGTGYAVEHGEWVVTRSRVTHPYFVIGADGHRSRVRTIAGAAFPEVGTARSFAVFEFRTEADLGDEMRVMFADDQVNLVWPMPDGYSRWSFEVPIEEAPTQSRVKDRSEVQFGGVGYPVLEPESLERLLAERAPWFEGGVEDLRWRLLVRFERRLASMAGSGALWLAGDALHMTGPIGVQSMNVGLREARDLAGRIADVLEGNSGKEALDDYARERRDEWEFLLGLDGSVSAGSGLDARLGAYLPELPSMIPASGDDLATLLSALGADVETGVPA